MHIAWTAHLANKPREKEDFSTEVSSSKAVLDRLQQIITEREQSLESKEFSLSEYEKADWAFKQAHINGRKAELAFLKLLTQG